MEPLSRPGNALKRPDSGGIPTRIWILIGNGQVVEEVGLAWAIDDREPHSMLQAEGW